MTIPAREGMTIPEAMAKSGATWRQVHYWISCGWLISSRGDGWAHRLSAEEVSVAKIMVRLIDAGFTAQRSAALAREVLHSSGDPIALNAWVSVDVTYEPEGGDHV